ncbi:MAG: aminomethyl-transferring glycine dehydrogenase subunit GcvPB, partial [Zestosphaera sp.]
MTFRQAKWEEPIVFELSSFSKQTFLIDDEFVNEASEALRRAPKSLIRSSELKIPNLSEVEVVRHYNRLSQMSYGVDVG